MWILQLGSLIEARRGTAWLLGFVLVNAVVPNLAQYFVTHSPFFGGLSGVVFALSGYAWQRGKHDPGSGIGLPPNTVLFLTVYFVLCWLGELNAFGSLGMVTGLNRVANTVHTAGLVIGAVWGWWDARRGLVRR
jgi:GlpG protein